MGVRKKKEFNFLAFWSILGKVGRSLSGKKADGGVMGGRWGWNSRPWAVF